MMRRIFNFIFILTILFLIPLSDLFSQREAADSLQKELEDVQGKTRIEILNELSKAYWNISLDSGLIYAQEAREQAEELNDKGSLSDALNRIGNVYYLMGDYEKALEKYHECLGLRKMLNDGERLKQIYNNLGVFYSSKGDYRMAKDYYTKAFEWSKKQKNDNEAGTYSLRLSSLYTVDNKYDTAIEYLLEAEEYYKNTSNTIGLGNVYNQKSYIYRRISSYDKSLQSALKALDYHKSADNRNGLITSYNDIGIIHQRLNNYSKALEYYNQMIALLEDVEQENDLAIAYNNIGIVYDETGEDEKALDYYQKAYDIHEKSGERQGMASALNNIGLVYFEIEDYEEALDYLYESLELSKELNDRESIANTNNNIGEVLLEQGDYELARKRIEKGLKLAKEEDVKEYIEESYRLLSDLNEVRKNYKEALHYHKLHEELHDSIFSDEKQNRISEIQTKYETEQKEKEIELLKRAHELKVKRQQTIILFTIIGVGMLIIVLLLIYNQFKLKKKNAKILEEKNKQLEQFNEKLKQSESNLKSLNATKDKFFSIIAHDLKNPFQALLGFSEVLYKNSNTLDKDSVKEYSKAIYESSQNVYNLLENLLQWSRSQLGSIKLMPRTMNLKYSVDDILNLLQINAEEKNLDIKNLITEEETAYVDENVFSSVLRNLLNNAIKFTDDGGKIEIRSKRDNSNVIVEVSDTGRGIAKEDIEKLFHIESSITTKGTSDESGTGLGLILSKELIEKSRGRIEVESEIGKGSTFKIYLPVEPNDNQDA
ncbi:MAG: tetratricopeptide repeat protein [Bacteroidales bacterium]